jgi:hypothetical protein
MEESKTIELKLGDVSLNETLGVYYIDMRPAKIHYSKNIYNGKFDELGVPMCTVSSNELKYFPINIAQYGFMLHADYLHSKSDATLKTLLYCIDRLEVLKTETQTEAIWWHDYHEEKYNIRPNWASAMAQGEIISLYLRVYQITGNNKLLKTAEKAYAFLQNDTSDKKVRIYDQNGDLWFEEYPSTPSSYVLNGFIYALFGIYDLYRVTKNKNAEKDIQLCIQTLKNNLHLFDAGYWTYYDLLKKELVRYYYQKNVHLPQIKILAALTGDQFFSQYASKWQKQITPFNYLLVQVMYRVLHRYYKLKKIIGLG